MQFVQLSIQLNMYNLYLTNWHGQFVHTICIQIGQYKLNIMISKDLFEHTA